MDHRKDGLKGRMWHLLRMRGGPSPSAHVAHSQGQQASPESRRQVVFPFLFVSFLPFFYFLLGFACVVIVSLVSFFSVNPFFSHGITLFYLTSVICFSLRSPWRA